MNRAIECILGNHTDAIESLIRRVEELEKGVELSLTQNKILARAYDALCDSRIEDNHAEEALKRLKENNPRIQCGDLKVLPKQPYKCPVCDGTTFCREGMDCKACDGGGLVWG